MTDFESMDTNDYDLVLNQLSKELFTEDKELDNDRVRLMNWALVNLLLNKGVITKEEYEDSVNEATMFFKLLKRRYNLQQNQENDENQSDSEV